MGELNLDYIDRNLIQEEKRCLDRHHSVGMATEVKVPQSKRKNMRIFPVWCQLSLGNGCFCNRMNNTPESEVV